MSLTTERTPTQEAPSERPGPEPSKGGGSSIRTRLGWAAVIAALVAVGVLATAVFNGGDEPAPIPWGGDVKDHPLYQRPVAVEAPAADPAPTPWGGDVKDHPLYRRSVAAIPTVDPTPPVYSGDVKDHPLFRDTFPQ